jgi:hypothetical protein
MAIGNILQKFYIFYDPLIGTCWVHLVHFFGLGIMHQEKSGNPDAQRYVCRYVQCTSVSELRKTFSFCTEATDLHSTLQLNQRTYFYVTIHLGSTIVWGK